MTEELDEQRTNSKGSKQGRGMVAQTFLLRLWYEEHDQVWRASLKTTADEPEMGFANLEELFIHLLRWTEAKARSK